MSDFRGRVAIVSGASSGIGEATVLRLGHEGADLVLLASPGDREDLSRVENPLRAMGARAVTLAADLRELLAEVLVVGAQDTLERGILTCDQIRIDGHGTWHSQYSEL